MVSDLTSYASQTVQKSLNHVKQTAVINLQNTTNSLKESIVNAAETKTERIKNDSSQYIANARQTMNDLGKKAKTSAAVNIKNTKNSMKESISNAAQSSKERIKKEISAWMPFKKSILPESKVDIVQSTMSKSASAANLATKVIAETTTQAAINMSSQVKESVSNATRWLWWWGLAAVGVYGISTTLTKEGVQVLKDMVSPVKSQDGNDGVVARSVPPSTKSVETRSSGDVEIDSRHSWLASIKGYFSNIRTRGDSRDT
jgi:hypothetical protein